MLVQECIDRNQELMLRRIVYKRLQGQGFYSTGLLKSGKAVGGGMIGGNGIEVACGFDEGTHSIYIFLPVKEEVREDEFFRRTNAGGRSVLVCCRNFPSDEGAFDGVDEIEQMVEECWPDIEKIIKHGSMILHYHEDKIYPDFEKVESRSFVGDLVARVFAILSGKNSK